MPFPKDQLPRLLVVLNQRFWDKPMGSSMRIRLLIEQLSSEFTVDIFHLKSLESKDINAIRACSPGIDQVFGSNSGSHLPWDLLRSAFKGKGDGGHEPGKVKDWRISYVLRRILKNRIYQTVLFEYIWTARFINSVTEAALPVDRWVDTHDVMHQRCSSSRAAGIPVSRQIDAATEAVYLSRFSRIIAIQKEEEEEFRRLAPDKEVVTLPVVITADSTSYPSPFTDESENRHILHVSSNDPIAINSLKWFLESVWPLVLREFPQARLHILGSICKPFAPAACASIRLHGFVENLAPFYQHADITINPCLAGSGIKIKTLEALAHGQAVVTTPFGAQGIDIRSHPGLRVVEVDQFAAALSRELA